MTRTHVFTHGAPKKGGNRKAANTLRFPKLPLLGSNQDSSDPESQGDTGTVAPRSARSRQKATERDTAHTKSHTVSHTPPRCLAIGFGNTGWAT